MPKPLLSYPETLEHCICKLVETWKRTCPSIVIALEAKNRQMDNFLLKSAECRAEFIKKNIIKLKNSGRFIYKIEFDEYIDKKKLAAQKNAK